MYFSFLKKMIAGDRQLDPEEAHLAIQHRNLFFYQKPETYGQVVCDYPEHAPLIIDLAAMQYAHVLLAIDQKFHGQDRFAAFFNAMDRDTQAYVTALSPLGHIADAGSDQEFLAYLKELPHGQSQQGEIPGTKKIHVNEFVHGDKSAYNRQLSALYAYNFSDKRQSSGKSIRLQYMSSNGFLGMLADSLGERHRSARAEDKITMHGFITNPHAFRLMKGHMKDSATARRLMTPYIYAPRDGFMWKENYVLAKELLNEQDMRDLLAHHGGLIGLCFTRDKEMIAEALSLLSDEEKRASMFMSGAPDDSKMLSDPGAFHAVMKSIPPEKRVAFLKGEDSEPCKMLKLAMTDMDQAFIHALRKYLDHTQRDELGAIMPELVPLLKDEQLGPEYDKWLEKREANAQRWRAMQNMDAPHEHLVSMYPYGFSLSRYEKLLPVCKLACELEKNADAPKNAFKLSVLFRHPAEAEKYVNAFEMRAGMHTKQIMHDACMFELPENGNWSPRLWEKMLIEHPLEVREYIGIADKIEKQLEAEGLPFPQELEDLEHIALKVTYKRYHENPDFAVMACSLKVPEKFFNEALDLMQKPLKTSDRIPDITIDGDDIGCPGYYMKRLPIGDARALLIGRMLRNCQAIGSAGEKYALHSFTSEYGGVYVWHEKNGTEPSPDDPIVAESWAWISKNGALVFDSFERIDPELNFLAQPFIEHFAHLAKRHGIQQVRLGTGGDTPELQMQRDPEPERWVDFAYDESSEAMYDSVEQYIVTGRNHQKAITHDRAFR